MSLSRCRRMLHCGSHHHVVPKLPLSPLTNTPALHSHHMPFPFLSQAHIHTLCCSLLRYYYPIVTNSTHTHTNVVHLHTVLAHCTFVHTHGIHNKGHTTHTAYTNHTHACVYTLTGITNLVHHIHTHPHRTCPWCLCPYQHPSH